MVVELERSLLFGFERCTRAYIGVWEESGWIKIQIRDKIQVCLKNEIPQNMEIRVGFE
jgi:hypothetical protein